MWSYFFKDETRFRKQASAETLKQFLKIKRYRYDAGDFLLPETPAPPVENGGSSILQELIDNTFTIRDADEEKIYTEKPEQPFNQEKPGVEPLSDLTDEAEENLFPEIGSPPPRPFIHQPEPAASSSEPLDDGQTSIAPSLFYNVLTAPAPTENDRRNRQAVSEHRSRKGAALRAKLAGQKEALEDLFKHNSSLRTGSTSKKQTD